ncbi:MAG: alpha/beta fold hydrolase [Dehalococcoidia bacterium]|nr:alpha/beta fold hydrolase [Dehalococcoidia bacterium]
MSTATAAPADLSGYEPTGSPIWLEALFPLDWIALHASPVYYGFGVPRGHGEPVVLVPGFLGTDRYLIEMHEWLKRIGYTPYYSGIGRNVDCPELLTQRLLRTIRRAHEETGEKVTIVGHSLGGMLARAAAHRDPAIVGQVVTMGSPFRSLRAHPLVLSAANFVRSNIVRDRKRRHDVKQDCYTPECSCGFVRALLDLDAVEPYGTAAIYSKCDGIVDWHACVEDDETLNNEVTATHIGMAFNPDVYRTLGRLLAGGRGVEVGGRKRAARG